MTEKPRESTEIPEKYSAVGRHPHTLGSRGNTVQRRMTIALPNSLVG